MQAATAVLALARRFDERSGAAPRVGFESTSRVYRLFARATAGVVGADCRQSKSYALGTAKANNC